MRSQVMSVKRGIVSSVLRTLSFHLATFACVIGTLFAISTSALLLLVSCLFVDWWQFLQKLTRILWRTEMAINALVADQAEPAQVSGSVVNEVEQQPQFGVVTLPVMLLSLLYFLMVKWVLNLMFSALPLGLWFVSIAQVLPKDAGLVSASFVSTGTTSTQVFTALAFAFLAHQLGVTSARGLISVSKFVSNKLFTRQQNGQRREQMNRVQFDERRDPDRPVGAASSSDYGTMGGGKQQSAQGSNASASQSVGKLSAEDVTRKLYLEGRSASEMNMSVPPMGRREMKRHPASFDGADFQYVGPGMAPPQAFPSAERAFQNEFHDHDYDQELQMCCCKVVIKSNAREDIRGGNGDDHRGISSDNHRRSCGGRGFASARGRWGRDGGRGGLRIDQMRPDVRGPPSFPPFRGFPPWSSDWRERWLEHWSGWQDWHWPEMDRRRRTIRSRRGLRRRNSFDDVYAVAVPVAAAIPDTGGDNLEKEPAHKSMYEALDLRPSAPPLPNHRPRWRSDGAQWERAVLTDTREDESRRHPRDNSLYESMSEPVGHSSQSEYWDRDEAGSDFEEDAENDNRMDRKWQPDSSKMDRDNAMRGIIHDQRYAHRGLSGVQTAFQRDVGEAQSESAHLDGSLGQKSGPAQRKQQRNERKTQNCEQNLHAAQNRRDIRHEDVNDQQQEFQTKDRARYAKEIAKVNEASRAAESKPQSLRLQSVGPTESSFHDPSPKISTTSRSIPAMQTPSTAALAPPAPSARARPAPLMQARQDPRQRALSSRARVRQGTLADQQVRSSSGVPDTPDTVELEEQEHKRPHSIAHIPQARSAHDISDIEIQGYYGNITRSYDDDDVTNMRAYAPLSVTGSPPRYITALDPSPIYRGPSEQPDYDSFSPLGSPRSSGTGRGSFGDVGHDYDVLSPTNSIHDAEYPTDKFQQVYRSIQMAAVPAPRAASSLAAEEGELDEVFDFKGVSRHRDRVNFSAFAPPSVCPSPKPFQFTVWAFLLNQRAEMQEQAQSDHPESRKLSLETKLNVRRGALVHVTLEVPTGFHVTNGATQGFAWDGEISSVDYDVVCTEGAAFGRVLFKARITVGSSVAVLNSFVLVGSRAIDPSELEADILEGWMDVMEQTYREIPYHSLEMKELVGQGYFGDAYRASLDGQDVVVKTIRASEFGETTSQIVREFQHEAAMLNMFGHHPCIVPFVGASTDTKFPLALITKYLPYGSLEDNLRSSSSSSLSIDDRTGFLKDAAAGLLNIHEGGFIHRDLAARNCLVDQGLHVRICDFGLCRRVRSESAGMLMKDAVGPVKYMAPESLQPPHAFSYDSDVYMFGVLMWETYTNSPPFSSLTPVEAMMNVLRGERLPVPKELPASIQTLLQNCFHDSPAERPSMQEVLTALDASLVSSQRASAAIAATNAATATDTAMAKSIVSRTNQDRSIWV